VSLISLREWVLSKETGLEGVVVEVGGGEGKGTGGTRSIEHLGLLGLFSGLFSAFKESVGMMMVMFTSDYNMEKGFIILSI
jgi:hypothetical protein